MFKFENYKDEDINNLIKTCNRVIDFNKLRLNDYPDDEGYLRMINNLIDQHIELIDACNEELNKRKLNK